MKNDDQKYQQMLKYEIKARKVGATCTRDIPAGRMRFRIKRSVLSEDPQINVLWSSFREEVTKDLLIEKVNYLDDPKFPNIEIGVVLKK